MTLNLDFTYGLFLNTVFTFLPTILVGIFDQDLPAEICLKFPELYKQGIQQTLFTSQRFFEYLGWAGYHSLFCFFATMYILAEQTFTGSGLSTDSQVVGTTLAFTAITVINLFSAISWFNWTWITHASLWGSMILFFLYAIVLYGSDPSSPTFGIVQFYLTTPMFYAAFAILLGLCLLPNMAIRAIQINESPTDTQVGREIYKKEEEERHSISSDKEAAPSSHASPLGEGLPQRGKKPLSSTEPTPAYPVDGFVSPLVSESPQESHARKASITVSLRSGVEKATKFFKKTPSVPEDKHKIFRAGSIVYMGADGTPVANTGFAFSHAAGMLDIITPQVRNLENITEEEEPKIDGRKKKTKIARFRNLSKSIQTVFSIKKGRSKSSLASADHKGSIEDHAESSRASKTTDDDRDSTGAQSNHAGLNRRPFNPRPTSLLGEDKRTKQFAGRSKSPDGRLRVPQPRRPSIGVSPDGMPINPSGLRQLQMIPSERSFSAPRLAPEISVQGTSTSDIRASQLRPPSDSESVTPSFLLSSADGDTSRFSNLPKSRDLDFSEPSTNSQPSE